MTFSEFGRRVAENASRGTDHGKGSNLFLIGADLKKTGIINAVPDLLNLDDGDVAFKIDFRNVYSDIITDWFKKDAKVITGGEFESLGVI